MKRLNDSTLIGMISLSMGCIIGVLLNDFATFLALVMLWFSFINIIWGKK